VLTLTWASFELQSPSYLHLPKSWDCRYHHSWLWSHLLFSHLSARFPLQGGSFFRYYLLVIPGFLAQTSWKFSLSLHHDSQRWLCLPAHFGEFMTIFFAKILSLFMTFYLHYSTRSFWKGVWEDLKIYINAIPPLYYFTFSPLDTYYPNFLSYLIRCFRWELVVRSSFSIFCGTEDLNTETHTCQAVLLLEPYS
jgi:hypothetical protein